MRIFFSIIFFSIFIFSCLPEKINPDVEKIKNQITQAQDKYVKDKRTAYFQINEEERNGQLILKGETAIPEAKKELIENIEKAGIKFIDSISVLPSPGLNGKYFGIVNVSVCNIRSKPKHSAELGTQALLGTPLRVWKKAGDFYFIQTPDNYFGWLDDGGFTPMRKEEYDEWKNSVKAVVLNDFEFLLKSSDKNSEKISDLIAGGILKYDGDENGFSKLIFPDGRYGFLKKGKLLPYPEWISSHNPSAQNILSTARAFLGRPYLWGGTSGKGVDCSGFTKTVYYLNGIQLERDASLQVHTGELIKTDTSDWRNLLPGDLLFFGRHATEEKKERISHVAIYMGDGKIIHSSDRVKIESLKKGEPNFAEDRVKSFIRAKRIIGSEGENGVVALKDSEWYN